MFFLMSKTLGVILVPSNLIIAAGLVGLILMRTKYQSAARKLLVICVVVLLVCGFLPLGTLLLVPLEKRFPPWSAENGPPAGIIVLGGVVDPVLSAAHGAPVFGSAADRIVVGAQLAHKYPQARLLFAGGNANLIQNTEAKEADFAAWAFESFGIARDRLLLERRSRNTQENAMFARAIAAPQAGERWLLVTSAFHMPRSVGIFRKVGFRVEPYPVDWKTSGWSDLFSIQNNPLKGMFFMDIAAREWGGLFAYYITGRTSELFPSPKAPTR